MSLYSMFTAARSGQSTSQEARPRSPQIIHHTTTPQLSEFHGRVVAELKQKLSRGDYHPSQRICPDCHRRFLQIDLDSVPLEYCRGCHGWWFDVAELMHFTELFEEFSDGDFQDRASPFACPVCEGQMRQHQMCVGSNLMVHACHQHGVFLKDGDFKRALEVSERVDGLAGYLNEQHLAIWRQLQGCLCTGDFTASKIRCLECRADAVAVFLDGLEIDYCTECQSCWFDTSELQHFTHQGRDVPGDYLASRESAHACPICSRNLRVYQFLPKANLFVDACPAGHGVYLGRGQFPRVLQASE